VAKTRSLEFSAQRWLHRLGGGSGSQARSFDATGCQKAGLTVSAMRGGAMGCLVCISRWRRLLSLLAGSIPCAPSVELATRKSQIRVRPVFATTPHAKSDRRFPSARTERCGAAFLATLHPVHVSTRSEEGHFYSRRGLVDGSVGVRGKSKAASCGFLFPLPGFVIGYYLSLTQPLFLSFSGSTIGNMSS
jgi:hypothetical protein